MKNFVRDIMVTEFDTIRHDAPIEEAIQMILNGRVRQTGDKTTSLMVLDKAMMFVGIITMADILYHLRPAFLNYGISGTQVPWTEQFDIAMKTLKRKEVRQLMSQNIVSASEDEHLMAILDRMVKNKYHRLPVVKAGKPIGIVYISDIYYHFFS